MAAIKISLKSDEKITVETPFGTFTVAVHGENGKAVGASVQTTPADRLTHKTAGRGYLGLGSPK